MRHKKQKVALNLPQKNRIDYVVRNEWRTAYKTIKNQVKQFAYNMICKDTIEEKIIALQNKKQFISDEVISTDDNFVKNLSEDDISFLFE